MDGVRGLIALVLVGATAGSVWVMVGAQKLWGGYANAPVHMSVVLTALAAASTVQRVLFRRGGQPRPRGVQTKYFAPQRAAARTSASSTVGGGIPGNGRARPPQRSPRLNVATVEEPPPVAMKRPRNRLVVRLNDQWKDLTGWRRSHPAGEHWIDMFDKADATEVMHAFHSDTAHLMVSRLPQAKPDDIPPLPPVTPHTRAFRELRQQLEKDGWFERSFLYEAGTLLGWATTLGTAAWAAHAGMGVVATVMLAVTNTSAGWIAHDYIHGRGRFATLMRGFGQFCAGMSTKWWSDKHNKHHALTNVVGIDEDLMVDPALWLWAPDPKNDIPFARSYQHLYWWAPYSFLFMLWRFDSIKVAIKNRLWGELALLAAHYVWLLALFPLPVVVSALFLSGLLSATIVTVSHTSEELFFDGPHQKDFVEAQFNTTRDFVCSNPIFEYLSGGMNYQVEHHLFPTMPRYRYPQLVPVLKKFAEENGLEYRVDSDMAILRRSIDMLATVAKSPPEIGAQGSR